MNLNFTDLQGQRLALLLNDSGDDAVYVVNGVVAVNEEGHVLKHEDGEIPLLDEWSERVQHVISEVENIVGAPLLLKLNIGKLSADVSPELVITTGLILPPNPDAP